MVVFAVPGHFLRKFAMLFTLIPMKSVFMKRMKNVYLLVREWRFSQINSLRLTALLLVLLPVVTREDSYMCDCACTRS